MMENPFTTLIGIGLFLFVGSIFLESTPHARMEKTCAPVRWTGNILVSLAALTESESSTQKLTSGTDDWDYGCQFTLWRLMYGKEYASSTSERSVGREPAQKEILPPGGFAVSNDGGETGRNGQSSGGQQGEKIKLLEK
jgi:hypothetical protein